MDLSEFFAGYLYKEDVQDLLDTMGLAVSGSKDELIARLLDGLSQAGEEDVQGFSDRLYQLVDKDLLKRACDEADLATGGTKDELYDRLMDHLIQEGEEQEAAEGEAEGGKPPKQRSPPPRVERISPPRKPADYESLLADVRRWVPLKRHSNEEGYAVDLHNFLQYKCGYSARMEAGETFADVLVDERFPIEVKKNPTLGEYDRMLGQLMRHERAHGHAIAVVCDVRRRELHDDFLVNLKRTSGNRLIEVVEK